MEIGSEFWLEGVNQEINHNPDWLNKYGDNVLTTSGRGAISLLLKQVKPEFKSVLIPTYICDSVIQPFEEAGYQCYYYEVDKDFSPNLESIEQYKEIGIFIHMGYFGFQTNSNLLNVIDKLKSRSVIIVEDITHTLYSKFDRYNKNDFYIGSVRKWFGIPSGGFLASSKLTLNKCLLSDNAFSLLRSSALNNKAKYMRNKNKELKDIFLKQFSDAETLLDRDTRPYDIDNLSLGIINSVDEEKIISSRRDNFQTLLEGLKDISFLEIPFKYLDKDVCPLFFPVIIKESRDIVQRKLVDESIYCPIHWPVPEQVGNINSNSTMEIYNNILSVPCDQRYGLDEMERVISVFRRLLI